MFQTDKKQATDPSSLNPNEDKYKENHIIKFSADFPAEIIAASKK